MRVDKSVVERRFASSVGSYDEHALAQRHIYIELERCIEHLRGRSWNRVLEVGCGTCGFTKYLDELHSVRDWTLNDLSETGIQYGAFSPRSGIKPQYIIGDAEAVDLGEGYDLIVSASVLQWLHDPKSFIRRLYGLLGDGGVLLVSTFGVENLREIRHLLGQGLSYAPTSEVRSWLRHAEVEEELYPIYFSTARDVLLHLKRTGVTGLGRGAPFWTVQRLRQFEREYEERYRSDLGLSLSYHPIYLCVQKPN